jgi:hypothetical protein
MGCVVAVSVLGGAPMRWREPPIEAKMVKLLLAAVP